MIRIKEFCSSKTGGKVKNLVADISERIQKRGLNIG